MSERVNKQERIKGRGAVSNASGRYERYAREHFEDDWGDGWNEEEGDAPRPPTRVLPDRSRSVIARNQSPDVPFDRSINPYRGCEHGCVYCFARPTHAYLGHSPGLDFETQLYAKHDAAGLLRQELAKPKYRVAPIALGANTDPYQPLERKLRITREVIEVLAEAKHPLTIVTKSALVLRDLDLLAPMAEQKLVRVCLSVTTLDKGLARVMEPRAATPARRLQAIEGLSAAGVPVTLLAAPIIPALNDQELEAILEAGAAAGAGHAGYVLLRLPLELKELFEEWLETHYPDRKERVLSRLRAMRGGALYDSRFGKRQTGEGEEARLLAQRLQASCKRLGLQPNRQAWALTSELFRPPAADGRQLSFL